MEEFRAIHCWNFAVIQKIIDALVVAGIKGIRIFFNLCDLPYKQGLTATSSSTEWQAYIQYCFDTMPNGMHAWTWEGRAWTAPREPMREMFYLCKKLGWLPVVCLGYQEELPHNWLGRAPSQDKYAWLGRFTKELALYLRFTLGLKQAEAEIFNEPTKLQALGFGCDDYCDLSLIMACNWQIARGYTVGVFSDDTLRQEYLDYILTRADLCYKVQKIFTHIGVGSEDSEWDNNLIRLITEKIARYPHLRQFVSELTVNGIWDRLSQLPDNTVGYGLIAAVRHTALGTATRMDDIWMYNDEGYFLCTSAEKAEALRIFNANHTNIIKLKGVDGMILETVGLKVTKDAAGNILYQDLKEGYLPKFVNEMLYEHALLSAVNVTTKFSSASEAALKAFQTKLKAKYPTIPAIANMAVDGRCGRDMYNLLIDEIEDSVVRHRKEFRLECLASPTKY